MYMVLDYSVVDAVSEWIMVRCSVWYINEMLCMVRCLTIVLPISSCLVNIIVDSLCRGHKLLCCLIQTVSTNNQ